MPSSLFTSTFSLFSLSLNKIPITRYHQRTTQELRFPISLILNSHSSNYVPSSYVCPESSFFPFQNKGRQSIPRPAGRLANSKSTPALVHLALPDSDFSFLYRLFSFSRCGLSTGVCIDVFLSAFDSLPRPCFLV